MLNNSANQFYENKADGFELSGGTTKRKIKAQGGDVTLIGGGSYIHTLPAETCTIGKRLFHGNSANYEHGFIYGKAGLSVGNYLGNATARDIENGFYPHFFGAKAITAVQGVLWTALGMCKGSAVANTTGNITRVTDAGSGVRLGATAGANTNAAGYNWFSMCAHDGTIAGMHSKVGWYTGNGTAQNIVFGGASAWEPDLVIVKGVGAQASVFRTSDETYTSGTECDYFLGATASLASQGIVSLNSDGFSVGSNAVVNTNAVKYTWMAFKSDADGESDFCLTSYTGIGGDGMHVDLPFQPDILFLIPSGALAPLMWSSAMTAGNTSYISAATADVTTAVIKADAYGFTIGANASINTEQSRVVVVAIKCSAP